MGEIPMYALYYYYYFLLLRYIISNTHIEDECVCA